MKLSPEQLAERTLNRLTKEVQLIFVDYPGNLREARAELADNKTETTIGRFMWVLGKKRRAREEYEEAVRLAVKRADWRERLANLATPPPPPERKG